MSGVKGTTCTQPFLHTRYFKDGSLFLSAFKLNPREFPDEALVLARSGADVLLFPKEKERP
jgi:hypothetical protein